MKDDKPKRFTFLWIIPFVAVLDIAVLTLTSLADQKIANRAAGTGHAAPAFTLIGFLLVAVITVAALVFVVLRTIGAIRDKRREKKRGANQSYEYTQVERKDSNL